jgi:signal peptidase I, bacterial type
VEQDDDEHEKEPFQVLDDIEPYEVKQVPFGSRADSIREIYQMILSCILVIAAVFLINTFVIQQVQVDGSSMNQTLQNNDRLLLEKLTYHWSSPKRFDIVVFKPYESGKLLYIKRVIALPGETIQIKDGNIYIDGAKLKEHYGIEKIMESGIAAQNITLGKNEYFVMGDNRNNSKDSRDREVGLVKRSAILGKVFVRIWPLSKIGEIDNSETTQN